MFTASIVGLTRVEGQDEVDVEHVAYLFITVLG